MWTTTLTFNCRLYENSLIRFTRFLISKVEFISSLISLKWKIKILNSKLKLHFFYVIFGRNECFWFIMPGQEQYGFTFVSSCTIIYIKSAVIPLPYWSVFLVVVYSELKRLKRSEEKQNKKELCFFWIHVL